MFFTVRIRRPLLILCCAAVMAAALVGANAASRCLEKKAAVNTAGDIKTGTKLPVIMYHSMLKEQKRLGKYVISPDSFEGDLKYLQKNRYHTITVRELVDAVKQHRPLPQKPVMLTFDDGYYNNYLYAYPLAKKYGAKIIIAPVGYYSDLFSESDADHANYSHLTWNEIQKMMDSGIVEFQNHSYNLHSTKGRLGAQRKRGESLAQYAALLNRDVGKMQAEFKEKTGYTPLAFVYPYGACSKGSDAILKQMGFQATFGCTQKTNTITEDPECLYSLGRFLRPAGISSEAFFRRIDIDH